MCSWCETETVTEHGSKVFHCPPNCEQCKQEALERRVTENKKIDSWFDWRKK